MRTAQLLALYKVALQAEVEPVQPRPQARRAKPSDPHYFSLQAIIERDGPNCYLCGVETVLDAPRGSARKAERDHVIPLALGGTEDRANLRCSCSPCNKRKGARLQAS